MSKPYPCEKYWIHIAISLFVAMVIYRFLLILPADKMIAVYVPAIVFWFWFYVEVKRLHDANKTGWLVLLNFIPIVGGLFVLIYAGTRESDYVDNKWYADLHNDSSNHE